MSSAQEKALAAPGRTYRPGGKAGPTAARIPRQRDGYAFTTANGSKAETADVARLRDRARNGELGPAVAAGDRARLIRAAFTVTYPIVFDVVTRRVELHVRGHKRCSRGITFLDGACLDAYYDDVEALIDYLLAATTPIEDLEGWLAHWAPKAVVDGHRRRRGERGALQRPRMTRILAAGLGDDEWLRELAVKILVWVGVPAGAGADLWPLERWAQMRAERTGDHDGSTVTRVAAEVEHVLAVMRRRPQWYDYYVERPLGRKAAPVAPPPGDGLTDPRPLVTVTHEERADARISGLATAAVEAIQAGLAHDGNPKAVVSEVLGRLFLGGTGAEELDQVAPAGADQWLSVLLADPAAIDGIVERVLRSVGGES